MFFWRAKKEAVPPPIEPEASAPAVAEAEVEPSKPVPAEPGDTGSADTKLATASNVVAITTSKLSDRLAAAASKTVSIVTGDADTATLAAAAAGTAPPGQSHAYDTLRRAAERAQPNAHILVIGPPGTGRRTAIKSILEKRRSELPRPSDWVYLWSSGMGRALPAFSLPHGQAGFFVREIQEAISRAMTTLERMTASDDYRLAVEVIDEEFRHRSDKSLEDLKRRAEAQNIALLKTSEGFVLAPMHDGKVVRAEVFRSLPDGLQRDVEAKIAALESELKGLISALPGEHMAQGERLSVLNRETASRAVRPQIESVQSAFGGAGPLLPAIEADFIHAVCERSGAGSSNAGAAAVRVLPVQTSSDFAEAAPVVFARDVSAERLAGVIGHDSDGRIAIKPGQLMRANGGFLVVEAWRLAASPEGWAVLSAALETGEIKPRAAPGMIIDVEPIKLDVRVVLLAEPQSLEKLSVIDPGVARHFPLVARFDATAACRDADASSFGALSAAIAKEKGFRPIAESAAALVYKDACRRAAKPDYVSLDLAAIGALLSDADQNASAASSDIIRRTDIEDAVRAQEKGIAP
jgi:AAA domain